MPIHARTIRRVNVEAFQRSLPGRVGACKVQQRMSACYGQLWISARPTRECLTATLSQSFAQSSLNAGRWGIGALQPLEQPGRPRDAALAIVVAGSPHADGFAGAQRACGMQGSELHI
jgi:hypothetical protein